MKRCARCTLPETYPGIRFDSSGVCSLCPPDGQTVRVVPLGTDALRSALASYTRQSDQEYDCIVGLSGGRDSTYALHYVVRVLGLRVLAYTVDNGFMPAETRDNVTRAVSTLGVEHVLEAHHLLDANVRSVLRAWLHSPSPAMIPLLCTGCRLALYRGFFGTARRYGIPLLISGLGEPESSFATRFFARDGQQSFRSLARGLALEIKRNPRYLLYRPSLPYWMLMEYLYAYAPRSPMQRRIYPQMRHLRLFEYIGWDEEEIVSVITSELGWTKPAYSELSWRADCKINFLKNHLYYRTLGFTKNDELVSNLIRLGTMTRSEGVERVERENRIPEPFLRDLLDELGIPYRTLQDALDNKEGANAVQPFRH